MSEETLIPIHTLKFPLGNYLKIGRLQDVITLITVLAVDRWLFRNEEALRGAIRGQPHSAKQWIEIALMHPEFFRPDAKVSVALLARTYGDIITIEGKESRKPLSIEQTNELIKVAILIFDKAMSRTQTRNAILIPVLVALLTGIAAISGSFIVSRANKPNLKPIQDSIQSIRTMLIDKK